METSLVRYEIEIACYSSYSYIIKVEDPFAYILLQATAGYDSSALVTGKAVLRDAARSLRSLLNLPR